MIDAIRQNRLDEVYELERLIQDLQAKIKPLLKARFNKLFGIVLNSLRDGPQTISQICANLFDGTSSDFRVQEVENILEKALRDEYVICYDGEYEVTVNWTDRVRPCQNNGFRPPQRYIPD